MRLSTLLRAMLDDASGHTPALATELDLARKFVEIEQVRFGDRLCVEWFIDQSLLEVRVPSLIVLPLVENAIRHCLSPKLGAGHLVVTAARGGRSLIVTVEDAGLGATEPIRLGVGLANTRARLEAMYHGGASLETATRPGGGFRATVRAPLARIMNDRA
jgi:two-component system, LytTR family, sensor kinase